MRKSKRRSTTYDDSDENENDENEEKIGSEAETDNGLSDVDTLIDYDYTPKRRDLFSSSMSGFNNDRAFWEEEEFYTKLYTKLVEAETKYNCHVNIPQFAFIGIQSSGKSSALSQMLGMPAGLIGDGSGTRCPIRFILQQDSNIEDRKITVGENTCKDHLEMMKAICIETQKLAEKKNFSSSILDVKISGQNIPNFVIVDLPGLFRSDDEKYKDVKKQLESITQQFLLEKHEDESGFRFIPVFIREAVDIEIDDAIKYVDKLAVPRNGSVQRPNWKKEAIIVVNKIDKRWNRPCKDLILFIEELVRMNPQNSVITICNPDNKRLDSEDPSEDEEYVKSVPRLEKRKWEKGILNEYKKKHESSLKDLRRLLDKYCGVGRLREIMKQKSVDIVKKSVAPVKAKLGQREDELNLELRRLNEMNRACNGWQLRIEKGQFDDLFLQNIKEYYSGVTGHVSYKHNYSMTWSEEMESLHEYRRAKLSAKRNYSISDDLKWEKDGYYLSPPELENELKKHRQDNSVLIRDMKFRLCGSKSFERALFCWRCMLSLMHLPVYSPEQILNSQDHFDTAIGARTVKTTRNLLLNASEHIKNGCIWLGNYMEWKLIRDGEMIYNVTVDTVLRDKNQNMKKIFDYTIVEYRKFIKELVSDFIKSAKVEPKDLISIIDTRAPQQYENLGNLLKEYNKKLYGENKQTNESGLVKKQTFEQDMYNNERVDSYNNDDSDSGSGSGSDSDSDDVKEDVKDKKNKNNIHEMKKYNRYNIIAKRDNKFYITLYGKPLSPILQRGDPEFVLHYARLHWSYLKFHVIKTIQEKHNHRIMHHIKQQTQIMSRALREGVEKPKLELLIMELSTHAGVSGTDLSVFIQDQQKKNKNEGLDLKDISFRSLNDEELEKIYGVDKKLVDKQIKRTKKQLGEFRKLRDEIIESLSKVESYSSHNYYDKL